MFVCSFRNCLILYVFDKMVCVVDKVVLFKGGLLVGNWVLDYVMIVFFLLFVYFVDGI